MTGAEVDDHLGYHKSERSDNDDYRKATRANGLTAAIAAWISRFPRIVTLPLNHR